LPIPIGTGFYLVRGDYGKKDLENADTTAPGGFRASLSGLLGVSASSCSFKSKQNIDRGLENASFDHQE
jgi:hypothetical protein